MPLHAFRTACQRTLLPAVLLAAALAAGGCGPRFERTTPEYRAEVMNPDLAGGLALPETGTVLVWGSDGSILRSTDTIKWQHAETPGAYDLNRGASHGKTIVVIGEHGSVLRSEDDGMSWRETAGTQANASLLAVAYDEGAKAWVIAGTQGVLMRSTDDGQHWSTQQSDKPIRLESLFYDAPTKTLWLGGEQGLLGHSPDGGETWTLLHLPIDSPITGFHRFGDTLLARSALGRLLVSNDQGKTWQLHQLATKGFFTDAAFEPASHTLLVTNHLGEVARSSDAGKRWTLIPTTFAGQATYLSAIRFDETNRNLIAVGHHGSMLRSIDGVRWEDALPPGIPANFSGLIYDAARKTMTLPGNGGYLLSSQTAGEMWQTAAVSLREYQRDALVTPDGSATLTTGDVGSIYRADGTASEWRTPDISYPNPATPPAYRGLVASPSGQAILAAGPPGTIVRSTDGGENWQVVIATPIEQGEAIVQLLVDAPRKRVVALDAFGAIKASGDDGQSWQPQPVKLDGREIWHGALSRNGFVVAVGSRGLILHGKPGVAEWQLVASGVEDDLYGAWCEADGKQCFALGKRGTILRSGDEGQTWAVVASGTDKALRRMVADPRSDALLAFGEGGTILRSSDGGKQWVAVPSGVAAELRAAAIEPGTGHVLLVGAAGTLLRSQDGGQTWQALPTHSLRHLRNLAINPHNGIITLVGERILRLHPSTPVTAPR